MLTFPNLQLSKGTIIALGMAAFIINGISFEPRQSKAEWSVENAPLTKHVSQKYHSKHNGIDVAMKKGTPIKSLTSGEIIKIADEDDYCPGRGYGKLVMIRNSDDQYALLYAHLEKRSVNEGENVEKGEIIGTVGATGFATGPHLHLSVFKTQSLKARKHICGERMTGETINPLSYLKSF